MKDPNYPSEQPKDPVSDALTDRNADPEAVAQDGPLKDQGDALLGSSSARTEQSGDDGPPSGTRDEGF